MIEAHLELLQLRCRAAQCGQAARHIWQARLQAAQVAQPGAVQQQCLFTTCVVAEAGQPRAAGECRLVGGIRERGGVVQIQLRKMLQVWQRRAQELTLLICHVTVNAQQCQRLEGSQLRQAAGRGRGAMEQQAAQAAAQWLQRAVVERNVRLMVVALQLNQVGQLQPAGRQSHRWLPELHRLLREALAPFHAHVNAVAPSSSAYIPLVCLMQRRWLPPQLASTVR